MENQNTTQSEGKKGFCMHGKKKKVLIICIAALLLFNLAARGLGMRGVMGWNHSGWGNRGSVLMRTGSTAFGKAAGISDVTIKDFEPLGIVFAESTASRRNGYGITHDALIREAIAKGADAIINVNIAPISGVFNRTWSGSALAIRYLDTVSEGTTGIIGYQGVPLGAITNSALLAQGERGFGRDRF